MQHCVCIQKAAHETCNFSFKRVVSTRVRVRTHMRSHFGTRNWLNVCVCRVHALACGERLKKVWFVVCNVFALVYHPYQTSIRRKSRF